MANKAILERLAERYKLPPDDPRHIDQAYINNLVAAGALSRAEANEIVGETE